MKILVENVIGGGDKNLEQVSSEAIAETYIFCNFVTFGANMRVIFEIMIPPDHVLCYIPRNLDNLVNTYRILEILKIYLVFSKIRKNKRYVLRSRGQNITPGGVHETNTCWFVLRLIRKVVMILRF